MARREPSLPATDVMRTASQTHPQAGRSQTPILARLQDERVCWAILAVAVALSVGLGLWLTRGATFYFDEVMWVVANHGVHPSTLLGPHNGNLIAGTRLIYAVLLQLFGADYLAFRVVQVLGVALVATLVFVIAKRRIGAAAALAPSVLLLFFGAAYEVTLLPLGIQHSACIAAGLGAVLALERDGRRFDVPACVLLTISVGTFSTGLAFVVGIAVAVLLRPDRWRRAWIVLIPLALYGVWYLTARHTTGPEFNANTRFQLSNVLLVPNYVASAASALAAAITGLSFDFTRPATQGNLADTTFGFPIALLALGALVFRIRKGRVPPQLWCSLAILLAFWVSSGLVSGPPDRLPNSGRYLYAAAVAAVLVATDAARGLRPSTRTLGVLFAVTVLALGANIALLRVGGKVEKTYSTTIRSQLAALEIERGHVDPAYVPICLPSQPVSCMFTTIGGAGRAGALAGAMDRYGSFGYSPAELRRQAEGPRELADQTAAGAVRLALSPVLAPPRTARGCLTLHGSGFVPVRLTLAPPGVLLRSTGPAAVVLGRFGTVASARAGVLYPGRFAALRIPADRISDPWRAVVTASTLTVCPLGTA